MKTYYFFLCMMAGLFLLTCQTEKESSSSSPKNKIYNPNGDSELALLMRDMWDDCMRVREDVVEGTPTKFSFKPEAIFTAHATEPEKAASDTYKQMGEAYLTASESFENASPAEKKDHFQALVTTCIACHKQLCPGPVRKIEKLFIDVD